MKGLWVISFFVLAFAAVAASVSAAPLTVVSGTITDANSSVVDAASVSVTCEHMGMNTSVDVSSGADGKYYAFFPALNCDVGDNVWVSAQKDAAEGANTGSVSYNRQCRINTALIDVQIPEFGVIAGGVALVGAVAGFALLRKRH